MIGLAGSALSFEATIEELLKQLQRFVDYDLCSVLIPEDRVAYVGVAHETAVSHYDEFLDAAAGSLSEATGVSLPADLLDARVADPDGLLDEDDDSTPMATYLSMPLRGRGGKVVGLLALSSATKNAFGEAALSTLKLIATPAAVVIASAQTSHCVLSVPSAGRVDRCDGRPGSGSGCLSPCPRPLRHRHRRHHHAAGRPRPRDDGQLVLLGVARPAAGAVLLREDRPVPRGGHRLRHLGRVGAGRLPARGLPVVRLARQAF